MVRIKPTVILGREAGFSEEGVHCKLHNMNINGHRILERTKILRKNEIFRKKWCRPKKTNNGRTTWIVQRNEKTIWNHSNDIEKLSFFYWTNKLSNNCFEQIKKILLISWTKDLTDRTKSIFFERLKKTNEMGCSRTMNESKHGHL